MTLANEFIVTIATIAIVLSTVHVAITAGLIVVLNFIWKSLTRIEAKLETVNNETKQTHNELKTRYHLLDKAFSELAQELSR